LKNESTFAVKQGLSHREGDARTVETAKGNGLLLSDLMNDEAQ